MCKIMFKFLSSVSSTQTYHLHIFQACKANLSNREIGRQFVVIHLGASEDLRDKLIK